MLEPTGAVILIKNWGLSAFGKKLTPISGNKEALKTNRVKAILITVFL